MGLFNSIFGGDKGDKKENKKDTKEESPWILLNELNQLAAIEKTSASSTQVIFKHSTTCGISRMVLKSFEQNPLLHEHAMDFYFLDLHRYRNISNEVAAKFQVVHQSPQLLVIKNGQTVAHDSHGAINDVNLEKYL